MPLSWRRQAFFIKSVCNGTITKSLTSHIGDSADNRRRRFIYDEKIFVPRVLFVAIRRTLTHELSGFSARLADRFDFAACFSAMKFVKKILEMDKLIAAVVTVCRVIVIMDCHQPASDNREDILH